MSIQLADVVATMRSIMNDCQLTQDEVVEILDATQESGDIYRQLVAAYSQEVDGIQRMHQWRKTAALPFIMKVKPSSRSLTLEDAFRNVPESATKDAMKSTWMAQHMDIYAHTALMLIFRCFEDDRVFVKHNDMILVDAVIEKYATSQNWEWPVYNAARSEFIALPENLQYTPRSFVKLSLESNGRLVNIWVDLNAEMYGDNEILSSIPERFDHKEDIKTWKLSERQNAIMKNVTAYQASFLEEIVYKARCTFPQMIVASSPPPKQRNEMDAVAMRTFLGLVQ